MTTTLQRRAPGRRANRQSRCRPTWFPDTGSGCWSVLAADFLLECGSARRRVCATHLIAESIGWQFDAFAPFVVIL